MRRCLDLQSPVAQLVTAAALVTTLAACSAPPPAPPPSSPPGPSARDAGFLNDWRAGRDALELKKAWYLTPQGSQLIDFDVFMSIAQAVGSAPFSSRESLESYGFLYQDLGVRQPGLPADLVLPIGMVKDTRGDGDLPLAKHAKDLTKDFVGLNCPACHTGEVKYHGERFLIHGGQSTLDFERFMAELADAVAKTVADPKSTRYLERMVARGADQANAVARLAAAKQRMDGLQARAQAPEGRQAGPGRIDAMGHIMNEVFGHQYEDPSNIKPVMAPVSVSAAWNAARLQCVQTNCLATNSLTRNVGEVLGVFGDSETYRDQSGRWRVRSTVKFKNIYALEEALDWVESPKWPKAFPPPAANVAEGATAFATYCQSCHAQPYADTFKAQWNTNGENWDGRRDGRAFAARDLAEDFVGEVTGDKTRYLWKVTRWPVDAVGTDDQFVNVHTGRYTVNARATEILDAKMRDGILAAVREKIPGPLAWLAGQAAELEGRDGTLTGQAMVDREFTKLLNAQLTSANRLRKADGSVMTLVLLGGSTASATDSYFLSTYPDTKAAAQARNQFGFFRARTQPTDLGQMQTYRARPLNGVAFTAPFGHNGVWPTLESVLFPERRPESFWVGHSEFDPVAAGVDLAKGAAICGAPTAPRMCFKVTTTEHRPGTADSGNSRSGHAGAQFYGGHEPTPVEKRAILEYLKSI